jgi:hypothetical protein
MMSARIMEENIRKRKNAKKITAIIWEVAVENK